MSNYEDPVLGGWTGQAINDEVSGTSGSLDIPNQFVGGLGRKLFGGTIRRARPTKELIDKGAKAKPERLTPDEQEVLRSIPDDQPPPEGTTPEGEMPPVGLVERDSAGAIDNAVDEGPTPLSPEEYGAKVEAVKAGDLENRTWERNINLDYIENAEQLGRILEVNAQSIDTAAHKSFDETRAGVDAKGHHEILKDVLKDTSNPQALTDEQLLAGREILLGLAQKTDDLAVKIADGDAAPETILLFEKTQQQAVMMQKFMQGAIRETARALNSMKIVAQAVNSGSIEQISAMSGNPQSAVIRARQLIDLKKNGATPADLIEQAGKMSHIKNAVSALVNLRNSSILTGFKTQAVNLISNTFYGTISSVAVRPMAAGIGVARTAILGAAGKPTRDRAYLAQMGAELAGFRHGFRDSIIMAKDVWVDGTFKNNGEYISSFGGTRKTEEADLASPLIGDALGMGNVPGVGTAMNAYQRAQESISFGLLTAGDEFFKTMAYRKSLYSQAVQRAYLEDIPESAIPDRVSELLNDVSKEMHDTAVKYSEDQTFTNRENVGKLLSVFADALVKGGELFPPLRLIVPFVRTPTALFDRTIKFSPLALIQKEFYDRVQAGGPDADMALAEMALGTIMFGTVYGLYQDGSITGQGPTDFRQRKVLEKSGWQANSVRLPGGTYIRFDRGFDPIAPPMLALASYLDAMAYSQEEAQASEMAAGAIFALAKHFKDNTYMSGVADLMAVIEGRKNWQQFTVGQVAGYVPSLARDAASISRGVTGTEETPRVPASNQWWDMLRQQVTNRLPGGEADTIQRYWDGTPVVAGGGEALYLYNSVSPVRMSRMQGTDGRSLDPSNDELIKNGIGVPEPSPKVSLEQGSGPKSGVKVDLLNDLPHGAELYDQMLVFVGKRRREFVDQVVNSRDYQALDDNLKGPESNAAIALETALAAGQQAGKADFVEWLINEQKDGSLDNPEKYGDMFELLSPEVLGPLLKDLSGGYLGKEAEQRLQRAGAKGVPSRAPIEPPKYVPDI